MESINPPVFPDGQTLMSPEVLGLTQDIMEDLDPRMTGQREIPFIDTSYQSSKYMDLPTTSATHDMTVYAETSTPLPQEGTPKARPAAPMCTELGCQSIPWVVELKNALAETPDPQREDIVEMVQQLSLINHKNPMVLIQTYHSMARFIGDAWADVQPSLAQACSVGYTSFLASLEITNNLNRFLHTKHSIKMTEEVNHLLDDLRVRSKQQDNQSRMAREFQEDLAKRFHDLSSNVSKLTESLEVKLLEASRPHGARQQFKSPSPTTSSSGPQQQTVAQQLVAIPSTRYVSSLATVSFDATSNMTMTITAADGYNLAALQHMKIPISVKIKFLNRDLYLLSDYFAQMEITRRR